MSEIQNQNLEGEGEPSTSTGVNVQRYTTAICDYCNRIHTLPVNPPKKVLVYYRDGWDDEYISPFVAVELTDDGEEGDGPELWMDDLFTRKRKREFLRDMESHAEVIDDEDIERALRRLFQGKYKKVGENGLGEIWERV